jgi:predicted amidohydrolase
VDPLPVAVVQTAPRLGALARNLAEIRRAVDEARASGARLAVFPELALTGYQLQDAVAAVALRADGERLAEVAALSGDVALVLGFVEEGTQGGFFNAALVAVDGRVAAVHRKRHLPTYGLFDEGRFFLPGEGPTTFDLEGWRLGVLICEEAWHPETVHGLVTGGAEALLILANGPGRGVQGGPRWQTQDAWLELVRYYARTYAVPALLANRTGVEEGLFFGGCSAIVQPSGRVAAEAPLFDPALLAGALSRGALRRARLRHQGRPVGAPPGIDPLFLPPAAGDALG